MEQLHEKEQGRKSISHTITARFTSPGAQVVVCPLGIVNVIIYILLSVSSYSCLFDLGLHLKLSKSNKKDKSNKNDKNTVSRNDSNRQSSNNNKTSGKNKTKR